MVLLIMLFVVMTLTKHIICKTMQQTPMVLFVVPVLMMTLPMMRNVSHSKLNIGQTFQIYGIHHLYRNGKAWIKNVPYDKWTVVNLRKHGIMHVVEDILVRICFGANSKQVAALLHEVINLIMRVMAERLNAMHIFLPDFWNHPPAKGMIRIE
jgi:hypothetical protein